MKRFFTVLEGPGRGGEKPLDREYMLVGRSSVADVQIEGEDLLISRRHLEVRIKDGVVYVKDISSKGSTLNGQRLKGEVSLNPGDVLALGNTKLQYQESAADNGASLDADETRVKHGPGPQDDRTKVAEDRTKVADDRTRLAGSPGRAAEADPDATHPAMEDQTRMLGPQELPGWKSPTRRKAANAAFWLATLAVIFATGAAAYWVFEKQTGAGASKTVEYKDPGSGFGLTFPPGWSRTSTKTDPASFRAGTGKGADWAQANVYMEKDPRYSITGLTSGFAEFQATLKQHFKNVEMKGSRRETINEIDLVFFGFRTAELDGVGVYTLNGDTRLVIEAFRPNTSDPKFAENIGQLVRTLELTTGEPQEYIDFPLPDADMKRLALASPAELERQVNNQAKLAENLYVSKDVRPDNLFRSVKTYREVLQRAIAGPQPLPTYPALAQALRQATIAYNQALRRQRFEISRALSANDRTTAFWAATRLMQMVPDKSASAYQEAYKVFRSLEGVH